MIRFLFLASAFVSIPTCAILAQPGAATGDKPAVFELKVPVEALVEIGGVKTTSKGETRRYQSPNVAAGKSFEYTIKVSFGGKEVTKKIAIQADKMATLDFRPDFAAVTAPKPDAKPMDTKSDAKPGATKPAPKPTESKPEEAKPKTETKPDAKPGSPLELTMKITEIPQEVVLKTGQAATISVRTELTGLIDPTSFDALKLELADLPAGVKYTSDGGVKNAGPNKTTATFEVKLTADLETAVGDKAVKVLVSAGKTKTEVTLKLKVTK